MAATVNLKASGLNTQQNQIEAPPGSLAKASNVNIRRDDVIESRRGFKLFGQSFGTSTDVAKQLIGYKDRLIRHYSNILSFSTDTTDDSGQEIFDNFSGTYLEPSSGIRIKSIEANGNLYFTTSEGIKRLSAKTASDLTTSSGLIQNAGGVKALDLRTYLDITYGNQVGFLAQDSTVAYRTVWGLTDKNNNLILGTPSQRSIIYNPLLQLVIKDFDEVLGALDYLDQTGSIYNDGNYFSTLGLTANSSAVDLYTNLVSLCTKIDQEQGQLAASSDIASAAISGGVCTITFGVSYYQNRQFQVGDKIYLNDFVVSGGNAGSINGVQTVVSVGTGAGGTVTFSTTSTATSVTVSSANIESGWFRAIAQPSSPSTPATHQQLLDLQTYLQNIITELQTTRNVREVAKNNGSATASPLELTTVGIVGTTVTINNDAAGDARNFLSNGDSINLGGTWNDSTGTPVSFAGFHTVSAAVTATNFQITVNGLTDPGVIDSTSTVYRVLRFTDTLKTTYIDPLTTTTTVNVTVNFTIPQEITTDYFYQIYRSDIKQASTTDVLADLVPDDEMRLVYEAFPTQTDIDNGYISILDETSDAFIQGSTYLYTNENTGEGILQSNDVPPLAQDINRYQNYIFYANTSVRQQLDITLLGVSKILTDYNNSLSPNILVTNGDKTNYYNFVKAVAQVITLSPTNGASYTASGTPNYFLIFNGYNQGTIFAYDVDNGNTIPTSIQGYTNIVTINISSSDTVAQVCQKTAEVIQQYIEDFTVSYSSITVTVTNIVSGFSDSYTATTINSLPGGYSYTVTTQGQGEQITKQVQTITTVADIAGSLASEYFLLNDIFDRTSYYIWYKVSGVGTDPALTGRHGIEVDIVTNDSAANVASKTATQLNTSLSTYFTASAASNVVTITNVYYGKATAASAGTSGFTCAVSQTGALNILLSTSLSPTVATDETAQSLVRVINRNTNEDTYAYYLSTSVTAPGQILLESRSLIHPQFYVVCNTGNTGSSFSPDLSPTYTGISNTAANPTVLTVTANNYTDGISVVISDSNSIPSINGLYTISSRTTNTFTIPVNVAVSGSKGSVIAASVASTSDNESKPNRLYYSKAQQPDAVPTENFIDIGAENKEILRIFPLRDSLFIFKEDGIYRLSQNVAPFSVDLFDISQRIVAPDSIGVANNVIYAWTEQGIVVVNESGASLLSRNIDDQIFKLSSSNYPAFTTATWGVGYVSDNAYIVYTVKETSDTVATIAYRYCSLTDTWTTWDKSNTCGIVNPANDMLYMGAGDTNYLEVERKTFTRTDYADREKSLTLQEGNYLNSGTSLLFRLETVSGISAGDVLVQEQYLTVYTFNQLLKKLDLDLGTNQKDYYSTLKAQGGDNLRDKIVALATKLDSDTGLSVHNYSSSIATSNFTISAISEANPTVITTSSPHGLISNRIVSITGSNSSPTVDGTKTVTVLSTTTFSIPVDVVTPGTTGTGETLDNNFLDIEACYNEIISLLNAEPNLVYKNYQQITYATNIETVISAVNKTTNVVTLSNQLPFVQGPMISYAAIPCEFIYTPITMGDPLSLKHFREAQIFFKNKAFTSATLSFSSDLIPSYSDIPVNGAGNGVFGSNIFGQGQFGGASNSIPFRTYVSPNKQRCRYLNLKFNHTVAREQFAVYGCTVTGEMSSTRAYR